MSWSNCYRLLYKKSSVFLFIIIFSVPSIFAFGDLSGNLDFFLKEGNNSYSLAHYDDAISNYDKVLEIEPDHLEALAKKGEALAKLDRLEEAISYFDKVIVIDPKYADEQQALYLNKILELDPKNIDALYQKGKSLAIYNNTLEEGISYFDKVLEIEPDHVNALYNLGEAYFQLDDFEQAILFYDKTLKNDPNHADSLSGKGYALAKLDNFEQSNFYISKALEIAPDNPDVLYKAGSALLVQEKDAEALSYFYKALKIDPNHYLSDIKFKFVGNKFPFKKLDGFVETKVYDSQGYLVAHLKLRNLSYLDHEIFDKTIDEWSLKKIINRNGQDYEVRQLEKVLDITYRFYEGGAHSYGIYFPLPESEFSLIKATYWLYQVEKGDTVKMVRTVFRPI